MILPVLTEPNPLLHQQSRHLQPEELKLPKIQQLIQDMAETMYTKDGVGIAAPQVGESIQLCVINKEYTASPNEDMVLVNPSWEKASAFKATDIEGCLSVPKIYGDVKRFKKIKVNALNKNGQPLQFVADGTFARIVQHEIDHLQGTLFYEKAKNLREITVE